MIIYSEDKNIEIDIIENEISHINSIIENERKSKKLLVFYMDKISNAINDMTNPIDINEIHKCLEDLKFNLDNANSLIGSLTNLLNSLNSIKENIDIQKIIAYNYSYKEAFDKFLQLNNTVYDFIDRLSRYTCIVFPEASIKEEIFVNEIICEHIDNIETQTVNDCSDLKENTLIISERNQNVVLPYNFSELQKILNSNSNTYNSIQDIVEKCYTRPLNLYKNAPFSRFKEALNLIKEREKGSLKQALDLGLELFFNSNLHPAVISACKNLDELDIYLDYLENGETYKFSCFDIVFDVAPVVVKNSKRS